MSEEEVFSATSVSVGDSCYWVFHVPAMTLNTKAKTLKKMAQDSSLLEANIDSKCGLLHVCS